MENSKGLPELPPAAGPHFSDSAGPMRLYGAIIDQQLEARAMAAKLGKRRKMLNIWSAIWAMLLPWGSFCFMFGMLAFYPHYVAPATVTRSVMLICLILIISSASAILGWNADTEARFYKLYLTLALTVTSVLGVVTGDINFWQFMQPSYHVDHLATYINVDPSNQKMWSGEIVPTRGSRYQDAGKIYFSHKAALDNTKAASFKDGILYCVAPIVNPDCQENCGYDFWAIGLDCCSEREADFRCGEFNNTRAKSGLRQVVAAWLPFFRLAVLQAEGAHGLTSRHPLFFHWVEDPVAELKSWKFAGYRIFIVSMIMMFAVSVITFLPALKEARTSNP